MSAGMRYQPQGRPRLNNGPLNRSLIFAIQGGSGAQDVVNHNALTSRGSAQAVRPFVGGIAFDTRTVNSAAFLSANGASSLLSDQTAVFDVMLSGAPSGTTPSIGGVYRSTTQNDALLSIKRDTADSLTISFRVQTITTSRAFNVSASAMYGKRLIISASVVRGPSGNTVYLRIASDGILLYDLSQTYTITGNTDATLTGAEYLAIGSESVENATRNANCITYAQYHFARVLDRTDVVSLSAQPWQLFQTPEDDYEVVSSGSTSDTIGTSSATSSVSAITQSIAAAFGTSVASSSATISAYSLVQSVATSSGVSTASVAVVSFNQAAGSATGTSLALAASQPSATISSIGFSSAVSTVSAEGSSISTSNGASGGMANVNGSANVVSFAQANSLGISTAQAAVVMIVQSSGLSVGISTIDSITRAIKNVVGMSAGSATVSGVTQGGIHYTAIGDKFNITLMLSPYKIAMLPEQYNITLH